MTGISYDPYQKRKEFKETEARTKGIAKKY